MENGKLIVIEGGDGSGKTTQLQLLVAALEKTVPVTVFDFPRYDVSVYGELIASALRGEHGSFRGMNPYFASLAYTLDRVAARDEVRAALSHGHVLCNRYVQSNLAFQAAKLPPEEREALITFIERGEYDELGIPKPDLTIILDVDVRRSAELMEERKGRLYLKGAPVKDDHETDLAFQATAAEIYRTLAKQRDDWVRIDCMADGKLHSRDDIHADVLAAVLPVLANSPYSASV